MGALCHLAGRVPPSPPLRLMKVERVRRSDRTALDVSDRVS